MPYALTLGLDLCDRNENSKKYRKWIEIELKGYEDYENLKSNFDAEISFDEWENIWASHRKIKCYIKASMPTIDKKYLEIRPLPYGEIFVAFPISQIVRMLQSTKYDDEFSVTLASLGKEKVEEIRNIMLKYSNRIDIPPDLKLFYQASELEKALLGVREKIVRFLGEHDTLTVGVHHNFGETVTVIDLNSIFGNRLHDPHIIKALMCFYVSHPAPNISSQSNERVSITCSR